MELPQYTLRPNTNRMVAPWILKLLGLSILFYGGIYFNVRFGMGKEIPPIINIFIFVFLIVMVVTQIILYNVRFGKYKYSFYTSRVDYEAKSTTAFYFKDFRELELKQGIFDKLFDTGSIKLNKDFVIGPVSNVTQVKSYIEQLLKYYAYMHERYKSLQQQSSMQQQMAASQPARAGQEQASVYPQQGTRLQSQSSSQQVPQGSPQQQAR